MFRLPLALLVLWVPASLLGGEDVDLDVVHRIKYEAYQHSQVMDILFRLTEVHGSRLTGSPGFRATAEWAGSEMTDWGLSNVAAEPPD